MTRRRGVLLGGALVGVSVLITGASYLAALATRHTETSTRTFDAPVRRMSVDSDSGRVRLERASGRAIEVTRTVVRSLARPKVTERLDGDQLALSDHCPVFSTICSVDWTVVVPDGVSIEVSASGGSIEAHDVNADLTLRSSGGGVHITVSRWTIPKADLVSGASIRRRAPTSAVGIRVRN